MNPEPLISVVIPTYNRGKLILRSINSVLNQTYKNIELIVVDDCSTDNTADVVKNIGDKRIKYIKLEKNSGACVARNRGIDKANGEYIAFNDSDDVWHSDKLEKQIACLEEKNADIVSCAMDVFDESANKKMYSFPESSKISEGLVTFKNLLRLNCTSTQLLFGRTECFKTEKFNPKMPRFQDWEECLRLSKRYKFYFQNEILVDTFQQKDSITKNPQKGTAGMNMLFEKYKDDILSDKEATVSFFKKMSSFTCRCGKNPVMEMERIKTAEPSFTNKLKYLLAKCGLYKTLFMLKN